MPENYPIVVIFDREYREQTAEAIEDALITDLSSRGIDAKQFVFFISDRKFECMLLAHIGVDGSYHANGCPHTPRVDGMDGVSELKLRLAKKNLRYHKTTTGLELFGGVRPTILASKSDLFKRFQAKIVKHCRWAGLP